MKLILRGSDGQQDIFRDIASLESIKVEDDLHTAQLNKLVENLESSLESYKSVLYGDIKERLLHEVLFLEARLNRPNSWQIII